jgi:AmmeMemoRadiSam system protein B
MKNSILLFLIAFIAISINAQPLKIRHQKDTVGFASKSWQMDSVLQRLSVRYGTYYDSIHKAQHVNKDDVVRFAICPHDDYTYAGYLYNELYPHIKAKTVIILGVAHKAKMFKIENKLVFDTYPQWHAAYGNMKISHVREQIMNNLPKSDYIIHDSLQLEEHSVEAFVPFLQHYDKNVEIVSILVPYMPFNTMSTYSVDLAKAILKVMQDNHLQWGKDIALLVSTDAVHYGDVDWGGSNYAPYGCDEAGYKSAVGHEHEIINNCLLIPDTAGARKFFNYTVDANDWHSYKWTWCGRYSVPFGILTAIHLQQMSKASPLKLFISDYSNSIAHSPLKVEDLKMGATAIATLHHWVGYAVLGYK